MVAVAFYVFSMFLLGSGVMVVRSRNTVHAVLSLIFAFFNAAGLFILLGVEFLAMLLVIVYVGAVAVLFLFVVMMLDLHLPKGENQVSCLKGCLKESLFLGAFGGSFFLLATLSQLAFLKGLSFIFHIIPEDIVTVSLSVLVTAPETFFTLPLWAFLASLFRIDPWEGPSVMIGGSFLLSLILAKYGTERLWRRSLGTCLQRVRQTLPWHGLLGFLFAGELIFMIVLWKDSFVTRSLIGKLHFSPESSTSNTEALGQVLYTDYMYVFLLSGLILLVAMIGAIVLTLRRRERVKRQNIGDQLKRTKAHSLKLKEVPVGEGL